MKKSLLISLGIGIAFCLQLLIGASSYAANPADFNPGRIIDDEVFYNSNSMSVSDIQAFLNAHVPSCDTWGTQPSGYGNLTDAQYAQQVMGWPGPPYVCLNNYYENPSTGQTSFEMGGGAFSGGLSAAQIIYNAAQQYGINPKVLLVTIRKESLNLFSDSWPMKSQYAYAMGYACPDSGPNNSANCNANYAGFYNQVTKSAWQLRYYYNHMGEYNYAPGRWNTIQYSPDPSCGTKNVFIDNYATASLYIYTPYTPNDASLNAYPGTAPCGSYGNRNFWFMWQEWFGSTYAGVHITSPLRVTSQFGNSVFAGIPVTASFDLTNDSSSDINIGGMTVTVRDSSGGNYDYALRNMVVPAHSTITYSETQTFTKEDTYTFALANYANGAWNGDYPSMINVVQPRSVTLSLWNTPSLTQGVTIQGGALHVGHTSTVTYTVKNNSASPQTIGSLALSVRGPNGQNLDPAAPRSITLGAGQSQTLSFQFKPPSEGVYLFGEAALLASWTPNYPLPDRSVSNSITVTSLPQVVLATPITTSAINPRTDQTAPLQFSVTNYGDTLIDIGKLGLWGRDPQGHNIDPGVVPTTLNPGETRVISFSFKPSVVGVYTFGVLGQQDGIWNNGPASPDNYSRSLSVGVKDGIVVTTTPALVNGSMGYQGQSNNIQFTVKNYGEDSANLGKLGLWGRDPQGHNIDPGVVPTTLNPGETRVISFPVKFSSTGRYTFGILQTKDNGITWQSGPTLEGDAQNSANITVTNGSYVSTGLQSSISIQNIHGTQTTTLSFSVTNQTSSTLNLGKLGLWGRDPQGHNIDPGVVPTTLNPGETRVISFPVALGGGQGVYKFGVLETMDNGATWSDGPYYTVAQPNTLQFSALPSVTTTASLAAQSTQVAVGQCDTLTFSVTNYDATHSANLGKLGLWGRDPQGHNIDPGVVPTTLNPGETRVISFPTCEPVAGIYTFGILQTPDSGVTWTDGPQLNNSSLVNKIQVTAK